MLLQETTVLKEKPSDVARISSSQGGRGGGQGFRSRDFYSREAQAILPCVTSNNVETYLDAQRIHPLRNVLNSRDGKVPFSAFWGLF